MFFLGLRFRAIQLFNQAGTQLLRDLRSQLCLARTKKKGGLFLRYCLSFFEEVYLWVNVGFTLSNWGSGFFSEGYSLLYPQAFS